MERPKVGVGIILLQDGKTLLGKRKGAHGEGQWAHPGGHLEFGETLDACVRRELAEETGVIPLTQKQGPWTNDIMENKHYITLWMFVPEFQGIPQVLEPHKCEGWEWFAWDALPQPLFLPVKNLVKDVGIDQLMRLKEDLPTHCD